MCEGQFTSARVFRMIEIFNVESDQRAFFFFDIKEFNETFIHECLEDILIGCTQNRMQLRFRNSQLALRAITFFLYCEQRSHTSSEICVDSFV